MGTAVKGKEVVEDGLRGRCALHKCIDAVCERVVCDNADV